MSSKLVSCSFGLRGQRPIKEFIQFFELHEALSQPSRLVLHFRDQPGAHTFEDFLGGEVEFSFCLPDTSAERFTGFVTGVQHLSSVHESSLVALSVSDCLHRATRGPQYSIFEEMDLQSILQAVLKENQVKLQFHSQFNPILKSAVQFAESDFSFFSRLLEEVGLCYRITPDGDLEVFDGTSARDGVTVDLSTGSHLASFGLTQSLVHGSTVALSYQYPSVEVLEAASGTPPGNAPAISGSGKFFGQETGFEYPVAAADASTLDQIGRRRGMARAVDMAQGTGQSSHASVRPGCTVKLQDLWRPDLNGEYRVLSVTHRFGSPRGQDSSPTYGNTFTCIPADMHVVPPRITPRPSALGYDLATVVQPASGGKADPLPIGRVRVKFNWSGRSKRCQGFSCWARVAQQHAGKDHGTFFMPEVGDEVIVGFDSSGFLEPVILGSLYTGKAKPDLKVQHSSPNRQKRIRTRSGNEILLEDTDNGSVIEVTHKGNSIRMLAENKTSITVDSKGDITVSGSGSGKITLRQGAGSMEIATDGSVTLNGPRIKILATAECEIKAPLVRIN